MFAGLGLKLLLGFGKAKAIAAKIPWQVYAVIGAIALLGLGSCVHKHKVKSHDKEVIAARDKYWNDKLDKAHLEAMEYKHQVEQKQATINELVGAQREKEHSDISSNAVRQQLLGPGKASCRQSNNPTLSGPTNGTRASTNENATGPGLPEDDRAAVPWTWLVDRAKQFDGCLSDNKAWWDWYDQQKALADGR